MYVSKQHIGVHNIMKRVIDTMHIHSMATFLMRQQLDCLTPVDTELSFLTTQLNVCVLMA